MNYLASVTFIFKDRHWPRKIGLATMLYFLPLVGWIALDGWSMDIFRRAIDDTEEELPGWEHWRTYLHDGLAYCGIGMIWLLVEILIDVIVGWPSWVTSIPADILLIGALIILVRTGSFRRAVNPVSACKALRPYRVVGLVVIAALSAITYLWVKPLSDMASSGLLSHTWQDVGTAFLLVAVLDPWITAIIYNLYGRLYRQCSTEA